MFSSPLVTTVLSLRPATQEKLTEKLKTLTLSDAKVVEEAENENINSEKRMKYSYVNTLKSENSYMKVISGNVVDNIIASMRQPIRLVNNEEVNSQLLTELRMKEYSQGYLKMLESRRKLPAYKRKEKIMDTINQNQVVLISGETGCGKTTQVAQFILDDAISRNCGSTTNIVCTQPRRISAISIAERVAAERDEPLGNSVGYQIRLEKIEPRETGSILFCTTGILLQFFLRDAALGDYSHVILDEIHERNTESDFTLTLLKKLITERPSIKVILMSATINSQKFSKYFNYCPILNVDGFSHPVTEYYLEDVLQKTGFKYPDTGRTGYRGNDEFTSLINSYIPTIQMTYSSEVVRQIRNWKSEWLSLDLVLSLTKYICRTSSSGAILIFLPGIKDVNDLCTMIESYNGVQQAKNVYTLHSKLSTADQKAIFDPAPVGVRKIIIGTSIAETSITIDDVVYVINCGKTKTLRFDVTTKVYTLDVEWITETNAKQRKGRAGRLRPGVCYHLFTKARRMRFKEYLEPEILRSCLDEVILKIKLLQLGKVQDFFCRMMDPPNPIVTKLSLSLLHALHAVDPDENLTPLGCYIAHLPVDPRTAKMILLGGIFSCVEPIFAIAASLSFKDAYYCPAGKSEQVAMKKRELAAGQYSDHLALAEALTRFDKLEEERGDSQSFCDEFFLCHYTMRLLSDMKKQFAEYLYVMKFLTSIDPRDKSSNKNSHNKALVKAIICAGLYPNIAMVLATGMLRTTRGDAKIHMTSINQSISSLPSKYMVYFLLRKYNKTIYLHDTTSISPVAILFAAPNYFADKDNFGQTTLRISGVLSVTCNSRTATLIETLHKKLNGILQRKFENPEPIDWTSQDGQILSAIIEVLADGDSQMGL